jgi:hypothetical protein
MEFTLWKEWMKVDPLLPKKLWPSGYRGPALWKKKQSAMKKYAQLSDARTG